MLLMHMRIPALAALSTALCAITGFAAETTSPMYLDEPAWVAQSLQYVEARLRANPPATTPTIARQETLMTLDGPLHINDANRFRSVHAFLNSQLERAVSEIENTRVTTGARVWCLYNHGFVVRTPTVTAGLDVVRGWRANEIVYGISDALLERLVRQLDVLTISHYHRDHTDASLRDVAFKLGVPVFADESIYPELKPGKLMLRPTRLADSVARADAPPAYASYTIANGKQIDVIAYPGHQGRAVTNNVYLLRSPDGFTIMHTGDQSGYEEDWLWMDRVGRQHKVDLLLVNCWTDDLGRMMRGIEPKLTITGHENEMAHIPEQRQPYWRTYQRLRPIQEFASYVLFWGEGVDCAAR